MQLYSRRSPISGESSLAFELEHKVTNRSLNLTNDQVLTVLKLYGGSPRSLAAQIRSPNHPLSYPPHAYYGWLVKTQPWYQLEFELESVDTEKCCDFIYVYDGANYSVPLLGAISGSGGGNSSGVSRVYRSSEEQLLIKFRSNIVVGGGGFSGRVTVVADKRVVTLVVTIENRGGNVQDLFELEIFTPGTSQMFSFLVELSSIRLGPAEMVNGGDESVFASKLRLGHGISLYFFVKTPRVADPGHDNILKSLDSHPTCVRASLSVAFLTFEVVKWNEKVCVNNNNHHL